MRCEVGIATFKSSRCAERSTYNTLQRVAVRRVSHPHGQPCAVNRLFRRMTLVEQWTGKNDWMVIVVYNPMRRSHIRRNGMSHSGHYIIRPYKIGNCPPHPSIIACLRRRCKCCTEWTGNPSHQTTYGWMDGWIEHKLYLTIQHVSVKLAISLGNIGSGR